MKDTKQEDMAVVPQRLVWTEKLVRKFWDGFSQTRLVEYGFSRLGGRSLIVAIDHLLPRNGNILDFGAGDGELVKLMCERGLNVAAYEPSEGRSEILNNKLRGFINYLGVRGEDSVDQFDVVVLAEVIEHILEESLEAILNRLNKLTKIGGMIVVTTPNNEDLDLGMAYCPVSNTLFHRWQHVRSFTGESLSLLMSKYGFDEVVTHYLEFNDALFVPSDTFWGEEPLGEIPQYVRELRGNNPTRIGGETNILFVGRKRE